MRTVLDIYDYLYQVGNMILTEFLAINDMFRHERMRCSETKRILLL